MKRVLILGYNGFIGHSLVAELSSNRDVLLTGFGRTVPQNLNGNISFVRGDFEDSVKLEKALREQEIVYHLISQSIPSSSWENPTLEIEKNLTPSIKMMELAAAAGVKKICFASSGGTVYGLNELVLTESSLTDPFSPYGIIKRALESFLVYAKHRFEVNYEIFRISNAYGPGQDVSNGLGFVNTALENIAVGRPVIIYGDGNNVRDFIYVGDVGKILARSVDRQLGESQLFNVSSNYPVSLNGLLGIIREVVGVDFETEYRPSRLNDNKKVILDNAKVMDLSGDISVTSLKEGLKKTYNHIKQRSIYVETIVR